MDQLSKLIHSEDIIAAWLACVMFTTLVVNNVLIYGKPKLGKLLRPAGMQVQNNSPEQRQRQILHNWLLSIFTIFVFSFFAIVFLR